MTYPLPRELKSEQKMGNQSFVEEFEVNGVVNGFIFGRVLRNIAVTYPAADTEVYTFKQDATTLAVLTVVYTTSAKEFILSVTRTT